MNRFFETEVALLERLRTLKASPEMSFNLNDIAMPMNAAGFSQSEIIAVLDAFEQEKVVAYAPGNRLLILKDLPD
ncbi:hypothetical protein RU07_08190 [Agrobacterium tumefaciens]|uniref:Uncharacterized protein n=1 Tax=Agrobacterium tumefaciens TaxID=358 RepID=A0A0D0KYB2_AGRTU|nr:hypothetical protein RU07_08190 [Agrobacterium tumefaciens]